ncbi:Box C/D snoRNA accumulation [Neocucurbitaria cava]|uniref:Box C/D snoRNA accumulation n=1 Tax=Neocucurbitaria cava TaxID=798079 RepID=A0A9W8Y728_9PLEO|nr:Box C/D snoRNA accumulation [Neocucurbitaria cava]
MSLKVILVDTGVLRECFTSQWAQCSGQRDPTKFVKKSQLVTPAGIDHDFNFLTGIERNLEKAERTVNATSLGAPSDPQPKSRNQPGGTPYGRLEAAAGVQIIRAPKGMSRQKENKSHPSSTKKAKQNVVWTIEWIDDANKRVLTETSSTFTVTEACPFIDHKSKKRKQGAEVPVTSKSTKLQDATHTPTNQDKSLEPLEHQVDIDTEESKRLSPGPRASPITSNQVPETPQGETHLAHPHNANPRNDGSSTQPLGTGQYRFFLLKPRTSSSRRVLIPLLDPSTQTLAEYLHGRTVLEFPTIYAFPTSATTTMVGLPPSAEFMLEEEYAKQEGEEQREFDELLRELDPEILKRLRAERGMDEGEGEREEEVDSKKILDVLKQDLGGVL